MWSTNLKNNIKEAVWQQLFKRQKNSWSESHKVKQKSWRGKSEDFSVHVNPFGKENYKRESARKKPSENKRRRKIRLVILKWKTQRRLGLFTSRVGSGLCSTLIQLDQIGWMKSQPAADWEDDRIMRVGTSIGGGRGRRSRKRVKSGMKWWNPAWKRRKNNQNLWGFSRSSLI